MLRLKNKDFSIFTSNCIGGIIYHRLHQRFLSPTINLFINNKDFIKFIKNFEYYINLDIIFDEKVGNYPIGRLGDIRVNFNHYSSIDEAKEKWNDRKGRINYSNMLFVLYEEDDVGYDDLLELIDLPYKIVVLTENSYDLPFTIKYKKSSDSFDASRGLDRSPIFHKYTFEKYFDYVGVINDIND